MERGAGRARTISLIALAIVVCAAALLLVVADDDGAARAAPVTPTVEVEEGGLLYSFHLPSGQASLFDTQSDPNSLRNLIDVRPDDAVRLRGLLEQRHGVHSLEELRKQYKESIDELQRLGYL